MKPEERLHRDIAEYLDKILCWPTWWTTFPAGGGGRLRGAILNGMGLKTGVPDILIIDGGRALWLELKAGMGLVKQHQEACHEALRLARSDIAVVRSIEDVETALTRWGVPLRGRIAA
jgi:hypothetical protein